jgi:hypothetical protein
VDDKGDAMVGGQYEDTQGNESQDQDTMYEGEWENEETKGNDSLGGLREFLLLFSCCVIKCELVHNFKH